MLQHRRAPPILSHRGLRMSDDQSIVPPANNLPYVIAVVVMMALGVIGAVVVTIARPTAENTTLIVTIFGFLTPTTLSLLAFMKAQETHLSVNSRLDAFMASAKSAAHAEGITEGRAQGRDSANERTDVLSQQTRDDANASKNRP